MVIAGLLSAQTDKIILICSLGVIGLLLIALGVFAFIKFNFRKVRRFDAQWQAKRDEITRRIADMKSGRLKFIDEPVIDDGGEEQDIILEEEDELGEEENGGVEDSDDEDGEEGQKTEAVLAISSLSRESRKKLDLREKEYNGKKYTVAYDYSFEAKLRLSDESVKKKYVSLMDEIGNYEAFEVRSGYRKERVCIGNKLQAVIRFSEDTLCAAFTLDPEKYTGSEYGAVDKTESEKFKDTPLVVKLTSRRELDFAKYLITKIAEANSLTSVIQPVPSDYDLSALSVDELFLSGMLKIDFIKEI